jgi:hypothetical protein
VLDDTIVRAYHEGGHDPHHLPAAHTTRPPTSGLATFGDIRPFERLQVNPMRQSSLTVCIAVLSATAIWLSFPTSASAEIRTGWNGKRPISYQQQKDLFYNYYAQPGPFNGAAAEMYVCPRPVPPFVGHTWVTYQPYMPHEFTYKHKRAYYTYNPGAGWRRTNVRYGTCGVRAGNWMTDLRFPMTNNIWALHNDFYYPGLRF